MQNSKKWSICVLALTAALLIVVGGLTAIVDPYFHYHAPLKGLQYPLYSQRYQNDGILRFFSYDAIIIGSSMTENFKASQCDALFGVRTAKTNFSGTTLKETGDHIRRGLAANPDTKLIFWGVDMWNLLSDKDEMGLGVNAPMYLYDDNLLNDIPYLLNREIFWDGTLRVFLHTMSGQKTTDFDTYSSWTKQNGAAAVLADYQRPERVEEVPLSQVHIARMEAMLEQNVLSLIDEYPDVTFYLFFTPYSILAMDAQVQEGTLEMNFQLAQLVSAKLLERENVRLFSFFDDYDTITNLENYCDRSHYTPEINALMLQRMAAGEYRLTPENNEAHWQEVTEFYKNYDFDSLFPEN